MLSAQRVLDRLVPELAKAVHVPANVEDLKVSGFIIPDSESLVREEAGTALMLAVRVSTDAEALQTVHESGNCSMVVLPHMDVGTAVKQAAKEAGIAVVTLRPGTSWARAVGVLHEIFDPAAAQPTPAAEVLIPDPEGDLFSVADSVGSLIGAPVTIEDTRSRVIAFSAHQGQVDGARVESIIQRKVPEQYLERMRRHGVFRRLIASDEPIFVPGRQPDIRPRAAIAIKAGQEILGSIWVVADAPLSLEHRQILRNAASVVAVHLIRRRQSSDFERRVHTETVGQLLTGALVADGGAEWLARPDRRWCVVAARLDGGGETAPHHGHQDAEWVRNAVTDGLRTHLMASAPESMVALVGDSIYGVVTITGTEAKSRRALRGFLEQFVSGFGRNANYPGLNVGIGSVVDQLRDIPESRFLADLIVRVLESRSAKDIVADLDEVGAAALVHVGRGTVRDLPELGGQAVARIRAFDAENQTFLAETLYAWLRSHGSSDRAAEELHVHPNTVRYRVRQMREHRLIDLDDPAERYAAYLHLG